AALEPAVPLAVVPAVPTPAGPLPAAPFTPAAPEDPPPAGVHPSDNPKERSGRTIRRLAPRRVMGTSILALTVPPPLLLRAGRCNKKAGSFNDARTRPSPSLRVVGEVLEDDLVQALVADQIGGEGPLGGRSVRWDGGRPRADTGIGRDDPAGRRVV